MQNGNVYCNKTTGVPPKISGIEQTAIQIQDDRSSLSCSLF